MLSAIKKHDREVKGPMISAKRKKIGQSLSPPPNITKPTNNEITEKATNIQPATRYIAATRDNTG